MVGLTRVEPGFHQPRILAVLGGRSGSLRGRLGRSVLGECLPLNAVLGVPWFALRCQPFDGPGFGIGVGGWLG